MRDDTPLGFDHCQLRTEPVTPRAPKAGNVLAFQVGSDTGWGDQPIGAIGKAALAQTAWFIDPQNVTGLANDNNAGLTATTPLRTIAELASRYTTTQPKFAAPSFRTVVTLMSDTNATDPWEFCPIAGTMVCTGTLTQQQLGQFNAFTARNQAAGTKATGGTASFASWVLFVGMLVQDTTAAPNAWFTVDADTGGGTATFTQPESDPRSNVGAIIPSMLTPAAGDNFTIWRPSIVHMTESGGLSVNAQVILQNGTGTPVAVGGQVNFFGGIVGQLFPLNIYVTATAQNEGNDTGAAAISNGRPFFAGCAMLKGCEMESHFVYGGSIAAPFVLRAAGTQAVYGGGLIFNAPAGIQSFSSPGKHQFGDVGFFCSNLNLLGAGNGRQGAGVVDTGTDATPAGATPAVWGPSIWPIKSGGIHMCKVSFVAELKVTGAITLAGSATAYGWSAAAGAYTAPPFAITPANLDSSAAGVTGGYQPGNMCGMFKEA